MSFDAHKNLAYSTVATAPSPASSGTSLVVAAGQGALFPAVPFNATVWPVGTNALTTNAEIVRVTNVSTDTLTITRAQEGTSARSILVGDQIAATITAKTFTDLEQMAANTLKGNNTGSLANALDLTVTQVMAMLSAATGIWTGEMVGFPLTWVSTTSITVGYPNLNAPASRCRDKADAAFITLAGGTQYTLSTATNGAALGDDSFQGPGTVAFNNSTTVTGTSTTFTTSFGTRTLSGTSAVAAGTALVGTGTQYLSEVAVNDLVGNATGGWARVTAITSDTALTLSQSLTLSSTCTVIEQPTISLTSDTAVGGVVHAVDKITNDTSLLILTATAGGSLSGKTYFIGRSYARAVVSAGQYFYVWLGTGGSGSTAYFSTQRTTPFGITGYTTSIRRIGTVFLDSSGLIVAFIQSSLAGNLRHMAYLTAVNTNGSRLLAGGKVSASWTTANANVVAPPTATELMLNLLVEDSYFAYLRPRTTAYATLSSPAWYGNTGVAATNTTNWMRMPCDGAQAIQWVNGGASAGNGTFIECGGYTEVL
jgi:hypothetical protein